MTQFAARWRHYLVFPLLALALAGCSSSDYYLGKTKEPDPNLFPAGYKKELLDTLVPLLEYPNNVRDAMISDPVLTATGKDQRYSVCVRANTRDERGRYAGPKDRIAFFYGGHLNQLIEATPEQCGKAAYKPFTELATYCAGAGCVGKR